MCSRQHPQPTQRPGHAWVPDRVSCAAGTPRSINSDTAPTPQTHTHKHPAHPNTPPPHPPFPPRITHAGRRGTRSGVTPKHLYYAGILRLLGEGGGGNGSPQHHPLQVFPLKAAQPLGAPPRTAASGVAPGAALGSAESIDLLRELQGMGDGGWGGQEHRPRVLLSRTPPTHPSVPTPSVPHPNTHLLLGAGALLVVGQRAARGGHRFQQLRHRASVGGGGQEWASKKGGGISACPSRNRACVLCASHPGLSVGWQQGGGS